MLTLFGSNGSGSAAVEMALMRCAVPYTVVRACHPASGLLPQDAAARAQAMRGLLSAAVVSRWSGTRVHLKAQRPAQLALLQRVESQPDLAPAFARHWPG